MELEAIFDHYLLRTAMGESLYEEEGYLRQHLKFARNWTLIGPAFRAIQAFSTMSATGAQVGFVGTVFSDLIRETAQTQRCALFGTGVVEYRFALRHGLLPQPLWCERVELHRIYMDYRTSKCLDHKRVERVIEGLQTRLKRLDLKALVLWNDVMFPERCLILAARALGIPSLVIQHGVYMSDQADARIVGGDWADYVLVWGEYFAQMFIDSGIASGERVKLLGYPRLLQEIQSGPMTPTPVICVLGQDWESYGPEFIEGKIRFVRNVLTAVSQTGLRVVYRPHPSEKRTWVSDHFPEVSITATDESLSQAFKNYDVFVSLTSTALLEAGLCGKIAVEVIDPAFVQDDFEKIGVCYSRPNSQEALREFFLGVRSADIKPFVVRPEYVWVPTSLKDQLARVLSEVTGLRGLGGLNTKSS